jgi:hypothetical protein
VLGTLEQGESLRPDDRGVLERDAGDYSTSYSSLVVRLVVTTALLARRGVYGWEVTVFQAINGLPDSLRTVLWVLNQYGTAVTIPVVTAAALLVVGAQTGTLGSLVQGGDRLPGLLTRNVLLISQKPKFVEMTNEYEIAGEDGTPVGSIRQEGQSKARKLLRLVSSVDQFLTHTLAVYDADGTKVLELVRPA